MKKYLLSTVATMMLSFLINGSLNASDPGNSNNSGPAAGPASAGANNSSIALAGYHACLQASKVPLKGTGLSLLQIAAREKCAVLYNIHVTLDKMKKPIGAPSGIPPAKKD